MTGFWIQDVVRMQYGRVLNILGFREWQVSACASIAYGSEYDWIWLNNALWQGSEYAWPMLHMVLNEPPFVELGHFSKHFVKNSGKIGPAGGHLGNFFPRYFQNYILNDKFNPNIDTIKVFLSKIRHFFQFQKWQGRPPLTHLVTILWVWLNMHKYPWICQNIFENTWVNCSDYAKALNMHHHLTNLTGFWRWLGF